MKNQGRLASDSMDNYTACEEPKSTRQGVLSQASNISRRLDDVSDDINSIYWALFGSGTSGESNDATPMPDSLESHLEDASDTLTCIENRVKSIVDRLK